MAPGVYAEPDRDESIAIDGDQFIADDGRYRLVVNEPMDEVAYLDRLSLDVVDRPSDVKVALDERFVPSGLRPTGALIAWRTSIVPVSATDLQGRDVTEDLRAWDRRTVDRFARRRGWTGYAEEHGIVLDFGDRTGRIGSDDRLVLCLAGWVEYPYSQTNYAAATAGVALRPPALERRRDVGSWEVLPIEPGYLAGLPRMSTVDLSGMLTGPSCVLRLRTTMECFWDQSFLARIERDPPLRVTTVPLDRATLAYRGFTREASPDADDRLPRLYDYQHVDPAPLARLSRYLTRYGPVVPLLQTDVDRFCLIGPGDEVRLEFLAADVPPLSDGWVRSYVLRAVGYCKDANPFTARSDTVGPLPWRGMPTFPFSDSTKRPDDPEYQAYLNLYQTRRTGER